MLQHNASDKQFSDQTRPDGGKANLEGDGLPPRPVIPYPDCGLNSFFAACNVEECSEHFSDKAPAKVYATLIDEGIYLCSIRTMHRILAKSRNVVGWMVAPRETAELAKRLIVATCEKQGIAAGSLTIHAARGT